MSRADGQRGFTLVELLVAMSISLGAITGAMTALVAMLNQTATSRKQAEAQDAARSATDRLAVSLRNGLTAPGAAPATVERALPYDMVFQSTDILGPQGANTLGSMRIRYCLDIADPSNGLLRMQTQRWSTATAPTMSSTTSCTPSLSGWDDNRVVAENVVNRKANQSRPIFRCYPTDPVDPNLCPTTPAIRAIQTSLHVDVDPSNLSGERDLVTGVTLRNANRPPAAALTTNQVGGSVVANASPSSDEENETLTYRWFVDGTEVPGETSVELTYSGLASGTSHTFTLRVTDPGGLSSEASKTVIVQ